MIIIFMAVNSVFLKLTFIRLHGHGGLCLSISYLPGHYSNKLMFLVTVHISQYLVLSGSLKQNIIFQLSLMKWQNFVKAFCNYGLLMKSKSYYRKYRQNKIYHVFMQDRYK